MNERELSKVEKIEEEFYRRIEELLDKARKDNEEFSDFRGFHFPRALYIHDFSNKPNFSFATFNEDISFSKSLTNQIQFFMPEQEEDFYIFNQGADFHECTFKGDANFSGSLFKGEANFRDGVFQQRAIFVNSSFKDTANFIDTTFDGRVNFWQAKFDKNALFTTASFNGKASLFGVDFGAYASFHGARFNGEVDFRLTEFKDRASFTIAEFKEGCDFSGIVFHKEVGFSRATFAQKVKFVGDNVIAGGFLGECDLTGLVIEKDTSIFFDRMNLCKASFRDTKLDIIDFRNVKWARSNSKILNLFRGDFLWDEIRPLSELDSSRDNEKIAENYSQLVLNYERKRDFDLADNFHIGEMEMRRKRKGKIREWFNGYAIYGISSRYGTSYVQAIVILFALILVFSMLFLFAGFQPSKESAGTPLRLIEYNLLPDDNHKPLTLSQLVSDYRESVLFTLSIITFQRERFYEPVGWQARLYLYLAVLVLTSQAALVLLALRRRFKR